MKANEAPQQYIPKSALVAEIERRKSQFMSQADNFHSLGMEEKRDHFAILASNMHSILSFLDTLEVKEVQEEPVSIWHDSSEMPKEKKVCLIRYSANDGASTNNFEVVIAEPLTRRFVTRSYPHRTGYQHTIHGESTIKVDEYQDKRDYIPFSDIDEWAYIDDLLNINL